MEALGPIHYFACTDRVSHGADVIQRYSIKTCNHHLSLPYRGYLFPSPVNIVMCHFVRTNDI